MANDAEVIVKLSADIADLKKKLGEASADTKGFSVGTVAAGTAIGQVAVDMGKKILEFAGKSLMAFAEQERAVTLLSVAVGDKAAQSFAEYANELQKTTTFTDDSILAMQRQLANFGVFPGSIKEATKPLLDFAAATGKTLPEAAAVMGQAMAGQGRELKKYGLELDSNATRSENLAKTTKFLQERFGGTADTIKKDVLGQIENMTNRMKDLMEVVGEQLTPAFNFWGGVLDSVISKVEKLAGASKQELSVNEIALRQLRDRNAQIRLKIDLGQFVSDQEKEEFERNARLIKQLKDMTEEDKKKATQKTKTSKDAVGAVENEIDAIQKLKNELAGLEQQMERLGEISTLNTEKRILNSHMELAQLTADQQQITIITNLETEKRLAIAQASYEANASFSEQLTVRMAENLANTTAAWVDMADTMINSFAAATARMILEGGKFSRVIENLWRQLAEMVIQQILRMIAQWIVFQSMTGGAGGFGGFGFMAEGGMINEPSLIVGMRTGSRHIAGEAGPERVVPASKGGGPGNFSFSGTGAAARGASAGAGGDIHVHITGQFIEGSVNKWHRLIKEQIAPEIRRLAMGDPNSLITRKRGALA